MSGELILEVDDDGIAQASMPLTTATPDVVHSLRIVTTRNWIDVAVGETEGAADIRPFSRLYPGEHILSFTPGAASYFVTARRDRPGKAGVLSMEFTGAGDLILSTPYTAAQLRSLRLAQLGDYRWVWVRECAPHAIVRRGNQSWSFEAYRSDDGPFLPVNVDNLTVTPSARTGEVTLEASLPLFNAGHVGALWQLTHRGQAVEKEFDGDDQTSDKIVVTGVEEARRFGVQIVGTFTGTIRLQRAFGEDGEDWQDWKTYTTAGNHIEDDELDNQIVNYRLRVPVSGWSSGSADTLLTFSLGLITGVCRIIEYVDELHVVADVIKPFGFANAPNAATKEWAEGAWSTYRGWPTAGALGDGRLQKTRDAAYWASQPDDFVSYEVGGEDADGIARTMALSDISPAQWIKHVAGRTVVGTEASEPQIRSTAFDEPITPTNMTLRELSDIGSANIDALTLNGQVIFVDRTRQNVHALTYDADVNGLLPFHLNRLHEDIGGAGGFIDLALQRKPVPRFHAPCADGQMAIFTVEQAENVMAISRRGTGPMTESDGLYTFRDRFESADSIPSPTGGAEDWVHVIVRREINGEVRRYHERIERLKWWAGRKPTAAEQKLACRVDCGVLYEGEAARFLTVSHLEGETVSVWGDGSDLGDFEVVELGPEAGELEGAWGIDLGEGVSVTTAWIGLPYVARRMSGKLPYGTVLGPGIGEIKKFHDAAAILYQTPLGAVRLGWSFDDMKRFADRVTGFTTDGPPPLFSGERRIEGLSSDYATDPRFCIELIGAGPAAVLGYVIRGEGHETTS